MCVPVQINTVLKTKGDKAKCARFLPVFFLPSVFVHFFTHIHSTIENLLYFLEIFKFAYFKLALVIVFGTLNNEHMHRFDTSAKNSKLCN